MCAHAYVYARVCVGESLYKCCRPLNRAREAGLPSISAAFPPRLLDPSYARLAPPARSRRHARLLHTCTRPQSHLLPRQDEPGRPVVHETHSKLALGLLNFLPINPPLLSSLLLVSVVLQPTRHCLGNAVARSLYAPTSSAAFAPDCTRAFSFASAAMKLKAVNSIASSRDSTDQQCCNSSHR